MKERKKRRREANDNNNQIIFENEMKRNINQLKIIMIINEYSENDEEKKI